MLALLGPDDPPGWCFRANANGDLPTCTWDGSQWHRSYESSGGMDGGVGGFAVFFVLALLAGVGFTIWRVSTARRMARDAGMDVGDATAMTLLSDDGFEATYLAANLRPAPSPPSMPAAGARTAAERLHELQSLLDQGLVTQAEYDARRQALLDSL